MRYELKVKVYSVYMMEPQANLLLIYNEQFLQPEIEAEVLMEEILWEGIPSKK